MGSLGTVLAVRNSKTGPDCGNGQFLAWRGSEVFVAMGRRLGVHHGFRLTLLAILGDWL
jgi:hypothetical protein